MSLKINRIGFFSLAMAALTMVACSDSREQTENTATETQQTTDSNTAIAPAAETTYPSFTLQDVNGNAVNLQNMKGKKVFMNLWATWCPPCRREMPSIQKLYQSVDTSKVRFVMLSLDDNFDKAKKWMQKQNLSMPVYYPAENLPQLFNVQAIPTTFIFNENGELLQRVDGADNYDSEAYRTLLK